MADEPRRARRMPLRLSLRYRRVGEDLWHDSITQNISRSGVLFRADSDVDPDVVVEIELRLPSVARLNPTGARVVGHARIVRKTTLGGSRSEALAAAFLDYDLGGAVA